MGFQGPTPRRYSAFVEVFGDGIEGLASEDPPCCLSHNRSLFLMGLDPDQGACLRILNSLVTVDLLALNRFFSALDRMSR